MAEGDFTQPAAGNYPSIAKGFGALTPTMWGRMMEMLEWFEGAGLGQVTSDQIAQITALASSVERLKTPIRVIMAKITGSDSLATNRFKYAWSQCYIDSSNAVQVVDGGESGTYEDSATTYAINLCEMGNTSTDVGPGVEVDGTDFPGTFAMQAAGKTRGGTVLGLAVPLFPVMMNTGEIRWCFFASNAIDGTC